MKGALLEIAGPGAWWLLSGESGTHRFCRRSPFDKSGRRHTSFVAVDVFQAASSHVGLRDEDLEIAAVRKGGKGGQHQNKNSTGIRMYHLPSKIEVVVQTRSQQESLRMARRVLLARLSQMEKERKERDLEDKRELRGASLLRDHSANLGSAGWRTPSREK